MTGAALLGTWVQDESGPVTTNRRRYDFKADGSYELVLTTRQTGSLAEHAVAREHGTFAINGQELVIVTESTPRQAVSWRVEKDRYVGNIQLVLTHRNGQVDVYYPE